MAKKEERIIKKYSNRRLYDTSASAYVTLEQLKDLILEGVSFRVVTTQNEDVTSQTLLSVLLSAEVMGQPVFSEQNLRNMVMFMHGPMRGAVKVFLEQCMPLFEQTQKQLTQKFGAALGPAELENLAMLQGGFVRQMMEQYVCRGLENYLATQKNIEKMVSQSFSFQNFYNPLNPLAGKPPDDK